MTLTATAIAGTPFLALLRRLKVGKEISEWGPESHQEKAGTPTMGGLLILLAIGVFSLAANLFGRYSIGLPLAVMASLGALGFLDDLGSLQSRSGLIEALNKRGKFVAFVAYGAIALVQDQTYLATFCFTVAGAVLGFLWYNSHPAQMFMGDAGALALGGGLAPAAFMTGQWLPPPGLRARLLPGGAPPRPPGGGVRRARGAR